MANLTFASYNCQGLGSFQKRKDVFDYLRKKKYSVYFLEDTHIENSEVVEKKVRAEWGFDCYFSSYKSNSRGVAILFNNNFEFKVNGVIKDVNGNYLIVNIKTPEKEFTLINIYGPNRDSPDFYAKIENIVIENNYFNIIWGGDWNLVLNPNLDYMNYKHTNNQKAREKVIEITDNLSLVDVWREINPEKRRYSWRRNNPLQQARLDFMLVSNSLISYIKDCKILPGYRSDHSIVLIELELKKEGKNANLWKFNSSLLKDKKYAEEINNTILRVTEQYSVPVYNIENIHNISKDELQLTISDQLFLDVILMEIRNTTINYASKKKKENNKEEIEIEKEILNIETKVHKTQEDLQNLLYNKEKLQTIRKNKIEGIMIRSRAKWAAEGEKVTKYFCNLENRHYTSKQMFKLINNKGEEISDTKEIVEETRQFYEKLYSSTNVDEEGATEFLENLPKLNENEKDALEGYLTLNEIASSLKNMKNGKSPGTDGMTVDFFKFFWKNLGHFVLRSLNEGFDKKKIVNNSERRGYYLYTERG